MHPEYSEFLHWNSLSHQHYRYGYGCNSAMIMEMNLLTKMYIDTEPGGWSLCFNPQFRVVYRLC